MEQEEGEIQGYSYSNEKISRHIGLKGHMGRCHEHFSALTNWFSSECIREDAVSG